MSSSIHLTFDHPVTAQAWKDFCREHEVVHSPRTSGGKTFYRGGMGGVEVMPDTPGIADGTDGGETFGRVIVGSFFVRNLTEIGALARDISAAFPCEVALAPELEHVVVDLPSSFRPGDKYDETEVIPTDFEGGWVREGDILTAKVPSGAAVLRRDGGLVVLEVEGIKRASFREASSAMAFAGRCDWSWWEGPHPEAPDADEVASLPTP